MSLGRFSAAKSRGLSRAEPSERLRRTANFGRRHLAVDLPVSLSHLPGLVIPLGHASWSNPACGKETALYFRYSLVPARQRRLA